ncbi:MAG TPA: hypothetical protein VKG21_08720 [Casimicrobiaceae bacterium]|nr:hypothetical protein [Casimicrobiaceae bacterium]
MSSRSLSRYAPATLVMVAGFAVATGVRAADVSNDPQGMEAATLYESAYSVCHPARGHCTKLTHNVADDRSNTKVAAYVPRVQIDSDPPYSACHPARGPCAKGAPPAASSGSAK